VIENAEMVKFAKNGSEFTTAAVKLARAHTGREGWRFAPITRSSRRRLVHRSTENRCGIPDVTKN